MANRFNEKFGAIEIENMVGVGKVGPYSARIWMRSERSGKHVIHVWPSGSPSNKQTAHVKVLKKGNDNTYSVLFPDDFPGLSPLRPLKRYRYRVMSSPDDSPVGEGRFETAPAKPEETPERFSIGVMSCHQPFDETSGKLSEPSMRMLKLTKSILSEHDAKFLLLTGDQIYSDHPKRYSLFDQHHTSTRLSYGKKHIVHWPSNKVRKAFQQRYRQFFWMEEVQHFYANYPCYPILDDWGSELIHTVPDKGLDYSNLKTGALHAYIDYQASRVIPSTNTIPPSFHYSVEYGNVGVFAMDLRTQRSVKPRRLYGPQQFSALKNYLAQNSDKHVILIVTSVPVFHLPDWLTDVGASVLGSKIDFPDHWSYKKNRPARNSFIKLIYNHQKVHPNQRLIMVSGDVHIGCAFAIQWQGNDEPTLYQYTSSAISNKMSHMKVQASVTGPGYFDISANLKIGASVPEADVKLLRAKRGFRKNNPFGGLNLGIIEIEKGSTKSRVTLKLIGYTVDDRSTGVEMFESIKI